MPAPFYAHSGHDWQLLKNHLREVADLGQTSPKEACPHDSEFAAAALAVGLLHDLGKYQEDWQRYLKDTVAGRSATSVPHAIQGAAYAALTLDNLAVAWAIAGHHTGLYDQEGHHGIADKLEREDAKQRAILAQIVPTAKDEVAEFPNELAGPLFFQGQQEKHRYEFWARVLSSILIDADRLNTEKHVTQRDRLRDLLSR